MKNLLQQSREERSNKMRRHAINIKPQPEGFKLSCFVCGADGEKHDVRCLEFLNDGNQGNTVYLCEDCRMDLGDKLMEEMHNEADILMRPY